MSERTARKYEQGPLPSEMKERRGWRTRTDPFEDVWSSDIVPMLLADEEGKLLGKTIFEELCRTRPGVFQYGQLRTLQRRIRQWRAESGPQREVYFQQKHEAGRMASMDFTHGEELEITIAGEAFAHLLFDFVLAHSGRRFVQLAYAETFEALLSGMQNAFSSWGGVPHKVRMDNLSAATHELAKSKGRALTHRFAAIAEHYGFTASRIRPGESHENGVSEKAHHLLKQSLDQALRLRGHRDFESIGAYDAFVQTIVERSFHQGREEMIAQDLAALRPLPRTRLPEYTRVQTQVRKWSTVTVFGRIYSVSSRLIGHEIEARVYADRVEVWFGGKLTESMPRIRGENRHRIDYRHVIWSLVRKPGAFGAYRFREDLFPSLAFRRAYDALRTHRGDRADVEYVRILHLAASTSERAVEEVLNLLLQQGVRFDYAEVKTKAKPEEPTIPSVHIGVVDLASYDALLHAEAIGGAL